MPASFRTNLDDLIAIFYDVDGGAESTRPPRSDLGIFHDVNGENLPPSIRRLLDHDHHMTVTQESVHQCPVDVQVVRVSHADGNYSRCSTLTRQSDGKIVQFGIVRLHMDRLEPIVRSEIEAGEIPLGRVLISHDVMRQVELHQLYRITAGPGLAAAMRLPSGTTVYGRTAVIYCDDQPVIELLEIVPE